MTGTEQDGRPAVPHEARDGQHWVVAEVPAAEARLAPEGKRCRYRGSKDPQACGEPAPVELRHGVTRLSYWGVCTDPAHSGGVWVEGGKIVHWELAPLP